MGSALPKQPSAKALPSPLERWHDLYADEMRQADEVIRRLTDSEASLIPQLTQYIVLSGGKRLRPILLILAAKLCGYAQGDRHINLAACIEFLHTATLLHDDVVDESKLRRGREAAHEVWGNAASVLVGDFLLSRAFQIMAQDGSIRVLRILSDVAAVITEGEVKQLMAANDLSTAKSTYIEIISAKTAKLFSAATEIGAVIAERPEAEETALRDFGQYLGIAFQIVDDALDYSARQEQLGKTIGDDFREGKVTLPVILAYQQADPKQQVFWQRAIEGEQQEGDLQQAISWMEEGDILQQTVQCARDYADKARETLGILPESPEKAALLDLLEFTVAREY